MFVLVHYALLDADVWETLLKERVRFAKLLRSMRHQQHLHFFYFVTGSNDFLVCVLSFRNIFGLFVREWETLLRECRVDYFCGPIVHGNLGNKSRHDSSLSFLLEPEVMAFLETLRDEKVFFSFLSLLLRYKK
jgi:hypothetical protein